MKALRTALVAVPLIATVLVACHGSGIAPSEIGETTASSMSAVANSNNQSAAANGVVPIKPAVTLVNSKGEPVVGVAVTFAVASGGGTLASPVVVSTDSTGTATAGRWTLGSSAGVQTVTATTTGLPVVTFTATATLAGAPNITRQIVVTGLTNPWDIAFAADGTMFYTQRAAGLFVRRNDGSTSFLYLPPDVVVQDQSGVNGVALDPQFATNHFLYLFHSSSLGGTTQNRVVRLTVSANYTSVSNRVDIVTGLAFLNGHHSGGRIRFGSDGYLYITTGDNATGTIPQSPTVLGGKVLRVDTSGVAAPANAPPAGFDTRVFTYGHRNPQGLASHVTASGVDQMVSCEHGPTYDDEVTPLVNGGNGGWDPRPDSSGTCPDGTSNSYCGYNGTPMTDLKKYPTALQPAWSTGTVSKGMSGCGFVTGAAWRDWNGALIVATLAGQELEVLSFDATGQLASGGAMPGMPAVRYRVAQQGPDGNLYVLTDGMSGGDEIWRLIPN